MDQKVINQGEFGDRLVALENTVEVMRVAVQEHVKLLSSAKLAIRAMAGALLGGIIAIGSYLYYAGDAAGENRERMRNRDMLIKQLQEELREHTYRPLPHDEPKGVTP